MKKIMIQKITQNNWNFWTGNLIMRAKKIVSQSSYFPVHRTGSYRHKKALRSFDSQEFGECVFCHCLHSMQQVLCNRLLRATVAGLLLWAQQVGNIDQHLHSLTAFSSKCEQCHDVSWRRKLNTNLYNNHINMKCELNCMQLRCCVSSVCCNCDRNAKTLFWRGSVSLPNWVEFMWVMTLENQY